MTNNNGMSCLPFIHGAMISTWEVFFFVRVDSALRKQDLKLIRRRCSLLARKRKEEIQQNNEAVLAKRREVADMPPVFGNVPVERTYTVQVPAVSEQGLKVGRYVPPCARMALASWLEATRMLEAGLPL